MQLRSGYERLRHRVSVSEWEGDTSSSPSPYVNAADTGNKTFSTSAAIDLGHPSIPPGTPRAPFQTERWDPSTPPPMQWEFPVAPGAYEVRLYLAEIFSGAFETGKRQFDVTIEGQLVLDAYDVYVEVGANAGVVESFVVEADDNLNIDFGHVAGNPAVKAIEVVGASAP